jgi:hypothetical protein
MLVGPRADRCQGLYGHEPPRDAGRLHRLLGEARAEATRHEKDLDKRARALQHAYDLALELGERLKRDASRRDLNRTGKKRVLDELDRVEGIRSELGERIGCPGS